MRARLHLFALAVLLFSSLVRGDGEELLVKTFPVTITCANPAHVQDQSLRVFQVAAGPSGRPALEPVDTKATFDDSGKCAVDLPAGTYRFEVLGSPDLRVIAALHTPPVTVKSATDVQLKSVDFGQVTAAVDKTELPLMELGVRSIGPIGEAAETAGLSSPIHLIATPGEEYACRFIAVSADQTETFAGWESFKAAAPVKIVIHKPQYNVCALTTKKDLPLPGKLTATISFPTSQLEWEAVANHRLLTNRDFLMLSYRLTSEAGETLQFLPTGYSLQRTTHITLGGQLAATGYADAVFTREKDGEGNRLFWVISLTDSDGHVADPDHSTLPIQTFASLDHADWTTASPYQGVDTAKLTDLKTRLRLRLTSDLPEFKDLNIIPQPFITLTSPKFSLHVPGSWTFRGRNYLAKLERMNRACRTATSRPGPAQVHINWRTHVNDAWALIGSPKGGGRGLWMSMQTKGLAEDDPFTEPWAMCHEMLHNFGYNHSAEMSRMTDRSLYFFNLARWTAWDNRAVMP
jgi:hypothetical protein